MAAAERAGVDFDAVVRQIAQRVGDAPAKEDRGELRQTLARYSDAIRDRDLDALRDVWPTLEDDDEKQIVSSFKMARSHTIFFAVLRIEVLQGWRRHLADRLDGESEPSVLASKLSVASISRDGTTPRL